MYPMLVMPLRSRFWRYLPLDRYWYISQLMVMGIVASNIDIVRFFVPRLGRFIASINGVLMDFLSRSIRVTHATVGPSPPRTYRIPVAGADTGVPVAMAIIQRVHE